MTLKSALENALAVTGDLANALNDGQIEVCSGLLTRRGEIMAQFQVAHGAADEAERASCQDLLHELADQDRELQAAAAVVLAAVGSAMRSGPQSPGHSRGRYDHAPETACVDRKA